MCGAWLTELMLDIINRELLEAGGKGSARVGAAEEQLRGLLAEHVEVRVGAVTVQLQYSAVQGSTW